jgi:predicted acetyltransferase
MSYQPATPDDLIAIVDLLVEAYHTDRTWIADELRRRSVERFRVLRGDEGIQAALELIRLGQWFGGQCVPAGVVAWVATRVAARGSGEAKRLLASTLEEMRRSGMALSTLYASTASLYRKLGYEWAGQVVRYDLPLAAIGLRRRDGQVQRVAGPDAAEIQEVYQACARRDAGLLQRDAVFWTDQFDPLPSPALAAYAVRYEGRAEGYVLIDEKPHDRHLLLRDVMFTTRRAGERLLTLLADHGPLFDKAGYWSGPDDPLSHLLPEEAAQPVHQKRWMLRIVDLVAALEGRGYAPQVRGELHFDVSDPVVVENAGCWRLCVEGGRGRVSRGGEGRMQLDIGALAALYSGYARPESLALAERVVGPSDDLALAALLLSGPRPYMADVF